MKPNKVMDTFDSLFPEQKVPSVSDFARGQDDCRKGIQAKQGQSEEYNSGYGVQYALEQGLSAGEFN